MVTQSTLSLRVEFTCLHVWLELAIPSLGIESANHSWNLRPAFCCDVFRHG
jgi:hypothetical protein